jgi:hypothetical protein
MVHVIATMFKLKSKHQKVKFLKNLIPSLKHFGLQLFNL